MNSHKPQNAKVVFHCDSNVTKQWHFQTGTRQKCYFNMQGCRNVPVHFAWFMVILLNRTDCEMRLIIKIKLRNKNFIKHISYSSRRVNHKNKSMFFFNSGCRKNRQQMKNCVISKNVFYIFKLC